MSTMMRQPSHSSSMSGSATSAASPKGRLGFFSKKRPSMSGSLSREDNGSSDRVYEPPHSDHILSSPFHLPDLEFTRSHNGLPSPDSVASTHDPEFLHLRENIRRLRKAPSGPDPKKVDAVWEVYKKLRDESLQLCKGLLQKSQNNGRNASLESTNIGPLDNRPSFSGSVTDTAVPFQVNDQWLTAINEYKATQEQMLENIQASLLTTYKAYESKKTEGQLEAFLSEKSIRNNLIAKWRDTSVHRMKSEQHLFWEKYKIRSLNFDRLKLDLRDIERLLGEAEDGEAPNMAVREYVIAINGDTILEFANAEKYPILRFRVSSHLLAEASPLFAQFLAPQRAENNIPLDMISQLPPSPSRYTCKDGMEVKVYRMPQIELNKHESLTTLLHAAHMHHPTVPKEIEFPVFVNIAEVCLRYRCTQPLELQVEYQWLPQWLHMVGDENFDGFLLISYAFGLRRIFTRMSKTAILNALDDDEIQSKEIWPQPVRDKIKATRAAKLAQIRECCTGAIEEYFRTPSESEGRRASVGSLQLTTVPRCPKGSHLCDATNLGWLMLVYNELQVLPSIMKNVGFHDLPKSPRRSLKELVDALRLMPSAPQVHSGVCDYAPAFRSAINDIYNSVAGLTLRDVSGRNGWALSKHAGPTEDRYDDFARDVMELEAPFEYPRETRRAAALSNEDISLRILSHLDDMSDLNSAAMIDKSFYHAYKRNEATLLKNIMRAQRRRTISQAGLDGVVIREALRSDLKSPSRLDTSVPGTIDKAKSLASDNLRFRLSTANEEPEHDIYDASPPSSPMTHEVPMSDEEAHKILWPDEEPSLDLAATRVSMDVVERNEKCLVGDVLHIEDKARIMEDAKHLRDEKDQALGLGIYKT